MVQRDRVTRHQAKITKETALEIRQRLAQGESSDALAKEFGLSRQHVVNIKVGSKWKILTSIPS